MSNDHLTTDPHPEPQLITLSAGRFMMGSRGAEPQRDPDEHWHEVCVPLAFALGRYPVTFAEYDVFCRTTDRRPILDMGWGRGQRPVINVSWYDAMAYCQWLSEVTGYAYRLPSEAEWEYACRAGTTTAYSCGETINEQRAVFQPAWYQLLQRFKVTKTQPVGQYPANPWGFHDMHGNVWEWTGSAYNAHYAGQELNVLPIDADAKTARVLRGGGWINDSGWLRSAQREHKLPSYFGSHIGFRVARSLPDQL